MASSNSLFLGFLSSVLFVSGFDITWNIDNSLHMPDAISSQLICHYDDTIFFIGGERIVMNGSGLLEPSHDIYRLDKKSNNTFEKLNVSLPNDVSTEFHSNYVCGKQSIYMFGLNTASHSVYIFDTISYNFTQISYSFHVQSAYSTFPCAAFNKDEDIIYIIGGSTATNKHSRQVLEFDVQTNTIQTGVASMPFGLYASMCNVINDGNTSTLYVFGGETGYKDPQNILRYDDVENKWTELKNVTLTQNRAYTNSIYDEENDIVLIVGGGSNTTDIFYVSNSSILPAFGDDLPYDPSYNAVSKYGNEIFVWGGLIEGTNATGLNNMDRIYVFNFGEDDDKKTWTTIAIVTGFCVLMFCCGCAAYALCGRNPKTEQDITGYRADGMNYQ